MLYCFNRMSIQNWPEKINTLAILILVLALGVGFGRLWGIKASKPPIAIIEPVKIETTVPPTTTEVKINQTAAVGQITTGKYVASKNSDKYHLPWCPGALRIKEENKVWFDSKEAAEKSGLTAAANCPGI